ncbi:MAG: sulfatase [Planctomycetota bacterium]|jgi:arylsulfatase A-like enzyme
MDKETIDCAGTANRISRRQLLKAAAGASIGFPLLAQACKPGENAQPNILIIILDALRASSLPMYGCPRSTAPFLERMAERSSLYKRCYASAPWTKPAVTGILTGLSSLEHRITRPKASLPESMPTIPKVLKKYGYHTGYFTANGMISEGYGAERHFDRVSYKAVKGHKGDVLIEEFENWLDGISEKPVFAYLHFFQPHGPYNAAQEFVDRIKEQGRASDEFLRPEHHDADVSITSLGIIGRIPFYQAKPVKSRDPLEYLARYEAGVRYGDTLLEELFAKWQDRRSSQRTLYLFTSDHGESLGEHGFFCHHGIMLSDTILHVPLIIHDDKNPMRDVQERTVSHLDFGNSILRWAGASEQLGTLGSDLGLGVRIKDRADRCVVTQTIPAGDGVQDHGEIGFATTNGPLRLVYNDCPTCGNANILEVNSGEASPRTMRRVPLNSPYSALVLPKELADGAVMERFGLHAPHMEAGKACAYSGRLEVGASKRGTLSLRVRTPGGDSREIGTIACKGGTTSFEGEVPALAAAGDASNAHVVLEARWTFESSEEAGEAKNTIAPKSEWQHIATFPLFAPLEAGAFLQLVGVKVTPDAAASGDRLHAVFTWQCLKWMKRNPMVTVRLLDGSQQTVWRVKHPFFAPFFENEEKIKPREVFHAGFRFEDELWIPLPEETATGTYRFMVEVEDKEKYEIGPVGFLEVKEDGQTAFDALMKRDAGLENFSMLYRLGSAGPEETGLDAKDLARFSKRFPEEGQAKFLLAERAVDEEAREKHLRECLARVPYHRAALNRAIEHPWGKEYEPILKKLTPAHARDFRFSGLIRLFGFDLERAPDDRSLYVTLYWEALSTTCKCYAAELFHELGNKGKKGKPLWWFAGTGIRPTNTWKIGEVLRETINLPIPPDKEKLQLSIKLFCHWDFFYNGRHDKGYLAAKNLKGKDLEEPRLGTFKRSKLPLAETDLLAQKRRDKLQYQLYNLEEDPLEERNLIEDMPEIFKLLSPPIVAQLEAGDRALLEAGAAAAEDEELPEEVMEQLRNLGYVK